MEVTYNQGRTRNSGLPVNRLGPPFYGRYRRVEKSGRDCVGPVGNLRRPTTTVQRGLIQSLSEQNKFGSGCRASPVHAVGVGQKGTTMRNSFKLRYVSVLFLPSLYYSRICYSR